VRRPVALPNSDDSVDDEIDSNSRQDVRKLLLCVLSLCAQFKDAKSAYMEPQMREMYYKVGVSSAVRVHAVFTYCADAATI
jgi:hypothetical protein